MIAYWEGNRVNLPGLHSVIESLRRLFIGQSFPDEEGHSEIVTSAIIALDAGVLVWYQMYPHT